ncbi:MAG: MBL fold metallo-hydrolase [Solobacterium sp.]|nr:MBL fold metallo-hydrolase [Solobacterium sp.]
MRIDLYNAGKADVILFRTDSSAVLIDTGHDSTAREVTAWLKGMNVKTIDRLIITHFDRDHVGGAEAVLKNFRVWEIFSSYVTRQSTDLRPYVRVLQKNNITPVIIRDEEVFTLDGVTYQIIGASRAYSTEMSNNSSLITAVRYGECKYLFMGDAHNERIEEFLDSYDMHADFLKVPYHGYYLTALEDLLQSVGPSDAVITNGRGDPPKEEITATLAVLREYGVKTWQTVNGTVTVRCNPNTYTITQR